MVKKAVVLCVAFVLGLAVLVKQALGQLQERSYPHSSRVSLRRLTSGEPRQKAQGLKRFTSSGWARSYQETNHLQMCSELY